MKLKIRFSVNGFAKGFLKTISFPSLFFIIIRIIYSFHEDFSVVDFVG